jgi:uncharacterized integral membrane protein
MKTEISKGYAWGYVLSEQDLRRISQTCHEHLSKLQANHQYVKISAKLRDGALIESSDINDITSLENDGSKAVQRVKLTFSDKEEKPDQLIEVQFQDGWKNPDSWTSINYKIIGPSRDWAFVASSEIEERIKKTKTTSFAYVVNHRWFIIIPGILAIILLTLANSYLFISKQPVETLENAYKNGEIHNPIEAIILLEKARSAEQIGPKFTGFVVLCFLLPFGISGLAYYFVPRIFPSYIFYWGDYIALYDKRKNLIKIFWTVIVLGILASLVAGLLLRVF